MKAIWTQEEASYQGEFVEFERIWSWPKPAQRPHPPVLVGGNGPTVLDRVLAFGDAWFPNYARGAKERIDVREPASSRARAERPIDLMVMGVPAQAAALEQLAARRLSAASFTGFRPAGAGSVEQALERWESAIAELTGEG